MLEQAKYEIKLSVKTDTAQDIHSYLRTVFVNLVDHVLVAEIKNKGEVKDGLQEVIVICHSLPTSSKDSEDILHELEKELLSKSPLISLIAINTRPKIRGFSAVVESELKPDNIEFKVNPFFFKYVASNEAYRRFLLDGQVHHVLMGYQEILGKRGQYRHSGYMRTIRKDGEQTLPSKANPFNCVAMFLEENEGIRVSCSKDDVAGMVLRTTSLGEFTAEVFYKEHVLMLSAKVNGSLDPEVDRLLTEKIREEFSSIAHLISINAVQTVKENFLSAERVLRVSYSIQPDVDNKATLSKVIERTIKPNGWFKLLGFVDEKKWLDAIRVIPETITGSEEPDATYEVDLNFIGLLVHNPVFCQKVADGSLIESKLCYSFVHDCPMPWVYSPGAIQDTDASATNLYRDAVKPYANVAKRFLTNAELRDAYRENRIVRFTLRRDPTGKVDFNFNVTFLRPALALVDTLTPEQDKYLAEIAEIYIDDILNNAKGLDFSKVVMLCRAIFIEPSEEHKAHMQRILTEFKVEQSVCQSITSLSDVVFSKANIEKELLVRGAPPSPKCLQQAIQRYCLAKLLAKYDELNVPYKVFLYVGIMMMGERKQNPFCDYSLIILKALQGEPEAKQYFSRGIEQMIVESLRDMGIPFNASDVIGLIRNAYAPVLLSEEESKATAILAGIGSSREGMSPKVWRKDGNKLFVMFKPKDKEVATVLGAVLSKNALEAAISDDAQGNTSVSVVLRK